MSTTTGPFFSIIIPALNEEKYLPLLLQDLCNQTIKDFEVIIIDGRSEDKTVEKSKEFDSKLPSLTILSSKIRNVSVQRNMGAEAASGKYLLFNDADNRLPKYYLEGLRYQLNVQPVDTFTGWCVADSNNRSDKAVATYLNLLIETAYLLNKPAALGAMIGCLRKKFGKTGGFNPEIGFAEDTEFVRQAHRLGYTFTVFHEPRFEYSLRRFRRMNKLKLIQKYAILNLKYYTNQKVDQKKEYPMGGGHEKTSTTAPDFIQQIQSAFGKSSPKQKIMDRIRALLSLEESEP